MNPNDKKLLRHITTGFSDIQASTSMVAHYLTKEHLVIQEQFLTMAIEYIKYLALMNKTGIVPIHMATLANIGEILYREALEPYGLTQELDLVPQQRAESNSYLIV